MLNNLHALYICTHWDSDTW